MIKPTVTLKPRKGKWYARIRWSIDGTRYEQQIPLRTARESEAYLRMDLVRERASSIASGNSYTFPWMNDEGKTKVKKLTLSQVIQKYINQRNHIRGSTLKRDKIAFNRLTDVLGLSYPIEKLVRADIEKFKSFWKDTHIQVV